ncbi:MAG: hypothetical protein U5J98_02820 [Halobacteriales archaeon]|nr:hypothetical protein [Halobacteriales archaeon]
MSDVTLLTGAVWGLAGAVAMVVVMNARGGDAPPPFAVFWARFLGDGRPEEAMPQALLLHAGYAVVAGAAYTVVFNAFDLGFAITAITGGVVWGLVYGVLLLVGAMVFWGKLVLDMEPDGAQRQTLVLAHLAFGLVLGVLGAAVPHLL